MPALVGNQQHVTTQLEQRAHKQNQIPAIDAEEVQQNGELTFDQKIVDERRDVLVHPAAASGSSSTCSAISAAKRSSPFSARRRNSVPAAPSPRSASPASRLTRQR